MQYLLMVWNYACLLSLWVYGIPLGVMLLSKLVKISWLQSLSDGLNESPVIFRVLLVGGLWLGWHLANIPLHGHF